MYIRELATTILLLTGLLLAGCTVSAPSSGAPDAQNGQAIAAAPPAPMATAPDTMEQAPKADPSNVDRSCRTDSDCAVKDVGNCCGAYPMCVNTNASTNPAAVQAQCGKDGLASVCGFREVAGCSCKQGRCESKQPSMGGLVESQESVSGTPVGEDR